jgi:hypothetical protein
VFTNVKNGIFEEVKKISKIIPRDQFLNMKQYGGYTMMIMAANEGHKEIVEHLIELGANPNEAALNVKIINFITIIEWRDTTHQSLSYESS